MKSLLPVITYTTAIVIFSFLFFSCQSDAKREKTPARPLTEAEKRLPENALYGLEVAEGLELTLFASEPMLVNPTNMDIDSRGRVWICEAYNYRNHLNPQNPTRPEGDRILILEDTDEDGQADKETVFYQGNDINSALGIAVIGNRVIVSVSPHVFVFTDDNGDDVPDRKEIMFSGIQGVQHDHGVHAFVFGPDGKLYFNFGNEGKGLKDSLGNVIRDKWGVPVTGEGKPYRQGMVFRCNPDGSEVEVLGHNFRNNYEVAIDSYGTLWQSDNDDDGNRGTRINYVMEYGNFGYRDAQTGAGWRTIRTGMNTQIPFRHWHLRDPGVVPNLLQTGAGSPTGIILYEGTLLPDSFQNQIIHCDAGPNVVRSYPVEKKGAGYSARIINLIKGRQDNWFRPSDVCVAPDGSLFIADWYDPGVGGHQMGDTLRGRIYRLAPRNSDYTVPTYDLTSADEAVEALKNPNLSIRASAWMALNKMGLKAESALWELWKSDNPRHKARALWLLTRIPGKGAHYVEMALSEGNEDLRIAALRAARQQYANPFPLFERLANDPSPQLRREVAIALRHLKTPEAANLWALLARQYTVGDRWYLEALGIGSDLNPDASFAAWRALVGNDWDTPEGRDIIWRTRARASVPFMVEIIKRTQTAQEAKRYFRATDFHPGVAKNRRLQGLLEGQHPEQDTIDYLVLNHLAPAYITASEQARRSLYRLLPRLRGTSEYLNLVDRLNFTNQGRYLLEMAIQNPSSANGKRAAQILSRFGQLARFYVPLNDPDATKNLAAITALTRAGNDQARDMLQRVALDTTREMKIRKLAVQNLGNGWGGENRLVDLLKQGVLTGELETVAATKLLGAYREGIRQFASEKLNLNLDDSALPSIPELATKTGDITVGMQTYNTYCSSCHVVNGQGIDFGPSLSEIGSKLSREALYGAIIKPSAGISFGYEGYLITLKNGEKHVGYIASETETELQLRMAGGNTQKIAQSQIASRQMMDNSLMTPGLHQTMSEEELVSLVDYLASLKEAEVIAGN